MSKTLPAALSADAVISVSMIYTGSVACDRKQLVDPCDSEKIDIPVLAFLLERKGKGYLFDLGLRPDLDAVPKHVQDIEYPEFPPTASGMTVPTALPADIQIHTVFPSHYHWDHLGNPGLLKKGTTLVFGKGSLKAIGPGYPDGDPWIDAAWLQHCQFQETEFDDGPIGDFPRGKDWFGDGSLWLIDCPGHCAGNMCALVRVSTTPETFVLLGGDCCHDQGLYCYPCHYGIATYKTSHGDEITLHEDHAAAKENMKHLHDMSQRENVMVVLAHEREVLNVIPCLTKDGKNRGIVGEWQKHSWKEKKLRSLPN